MSQIKPEKRLFTAYQNFYQLLTEGSDHKFNGKAELFVVGLTLGFLYNKRNTAEKPFEFIRYSHFYDPKSSDQRSIIEMIYGTMAQGRDDNAKWQDMLKIADGGIEILKDHYDLYGNIDASLLIKDAEKRIENKVNEISGD
jgi:hypothetical protein